MYDNQNMLYFFDATAEFKNTRFAGSAPLIPLRANIFDSSHLYPFQLSK